MAANVKYVRRPPNAFFLFCNEKRRELLNQNPGFGNRDVSKLLAILWAELEFDKKKEFIKKAEELHDKHLREHPGYKFNPWIRKGLRDRETTAQSSADKVDRPSTWIIWRPANHWPTSHMPSVADPENADVVQSEVDPISPEKQMFMRSLGLCQRNSTEYWNLKAKQAVNREPVISIIQKIRSKNQSKPNSENTSSDPEIKVKRLRGRPPKSENKSCDPEIKVKRPRGRPRKYFAIKVVKSLA